MEEDQQTPQVVSNDCLFPPGKVSFQCIGTIIQDFRNGQTSVVTARKAIKQIDHALSMFTPDEGDEPSVGVMAVSSEVRNKSDEDLINSLETSVNNYATKQGAEVSTQSIEQIIIQLLLEYGRRLLEKLLEGTI